MTKNELELASTNTQPPAPWTYWVVEGLLLAGPYPGSPDLQQCRDRLGTLLDVGVRTFVNLMEENETNRSSNQFTPYDHAVRQLAKSNDVRRL